MQNTVLRILALICLFGCPGCRDTKVAAVSGHVSVNGKPAAECSVMFATITDRNGGSISAVGMTDAEGNFTLKTMENSPRKGAGIGENRVILKWVDKDYPFNWDTTKSPWPKRKSAPYALPLKARNGELRFTVPGEGTKNANFDL